MNGVTFLLTPVTPADLLKALEGQVIGVGPGKSLESKVSAAQADYAAGNVSGTCGVLGGFINEVQAQSGKKIDPTLASTLIADANTIEGLIGCQ